MTMVKRVEWRSAPVWLLSIANGLGDCSREIATALLPVLVTGFVGLAYAPLAIGIIVGTSEAVGNLLQLIMGWVGDRWHKRPLVIAGYAVSGVFTALLGVAGSIYTLFLYRMLSRAGKGIRESARDVLLAECVKPSHYASALGFLQACGSAGALASSVVLLFTCTSISPQTILLFTAIPAALSIILAYAFTRLIDGSQSVRITTGFLESFSFISPNMMLLLGAILCISLAEPSVSFLLLSTLAKGSSAYLSREASFFFACYIITRLCMEYISGWITKKNIPWVMALTGPGLLCGIAIVYGVQCVLGLTLVRLLAFIFFGIAMGSMYTLEKILVVSTSPREGLTTVLGILYGLRGIGVLLGSIIIGALWSRYGFAHALWYIGLVNAVAILPYWAAAKRLLKRRTVQLTSFPLLPDKKE